MDRLAADHGRDTDEVEGGGGNGDGSDGGLSQERCVANGHHYAHSVAGVGDGTGTVLGLGLDRWAPARLRTDS